MLKRLMFPSFLLLLASCVCAQEKGGRVYEFPFVPRKDAFFVLYGENRAGKGDWVTVRVRIATLRDTMATVAAATDWTLGNGPEDETGNAE